MRFDLAKVLKEKHKPKRMCSNCREMKEKNELFRLVVRDELIQFDETAKLDGRGAYICKNEECIVNAFDKRKLHAQLKNKTQEGLKEELLSELEAERLTKEPREKKIIKISPDGSMKKS